MLADDTSGQSKFTAIYWIQILIYYKSKQYLFGVSRAEPLTSCKKQHFQRWWLDWPTQVNVYQHFFVGLVRLVCCVWIPPSFNIAAFCPSWLISYSLKLGKNIYTTNSGKTEKSIKMSVKRTMRRTLKGTWTFNVRTWIFFCGNENQTIGS